MKVEAILKPTRFLKLEDFLSTALRRMEEGESVALPVTDKDGTVIGIVSRNRVQAAIERATEAMAENTTVETATQPQPFACTGDDDVADMLIKASKNDLDQLAVTDNNGRVLGIADLAVFQHTQDGNLDEAVEETFPASDPISPAR